VKNVLDGSPENYRTGRKKRLKKSGPAETKQGAWVRGGDHDPSGKGGPKGKK